MTAKGLLRALSEKGVKVEATAEGNLRCTPRQKLSAEDIAALKANKSAIVFFLDDGRQVPSPSSPSSPPAKNSCKAEHLSGDDGGDDATGPIVPTVPSFVKKPRESASELGLVARWAKEFGFISIHDPTTGEWHDLKSEDAPPWARWESRKRRELQKYDGVTRLLSAKEMNEIWEAERENEDAGGVVYEDLLEEGEG